MPLLSFLRGNARWIASGFLLFLFSAVGQTYFISLSAGDIRREYGLSNGTFASLYMAATLLSALTLSRLGQVVDQMSARRVVLLVVPALATAAALMALSGHVAPLFAALYLLRLLGQGMMTHTAFTVMARWFSAERGKALSIATVGLNTGEALLPPAVIALMALVGWRGVWWLAAGVLLLVAVPLLAWLTSVEREPLTSDPARRSSGVRDWTRAEALRDPFFYLALLAMAPPAFIGNTVFFHQVHLIELRGWSPQAFAAPFTLYAVLTVAFALASGQLVDRLSALRLLPFYLTPLGLGCLVLGQVEAAWAPFAFMALYGVSNGFSLTLFGSVWPEIYGVRHLGAIRAVIVAVLVFASALGPGLTGILIDLGVRYPAQVVAMGSCCLVISVLMRSVVRRLRARTGLGAG